MGREKEGRRGLNWPETCTYSCGTENLTKQEDKYKNGKIKDKIYFTFLDMLFSNFEMIKV